MKRDLGRHVWHPGDECQITGAAGTWQRQNATVVGQDPADPSRILVRYADSGQERSVARMRLRPMPVVVPAVELPDIAEPRYAPGALNG